jgi:hypothetical protein
LKGTDKPKPRDPIRTLPGDVAPVEDDIAGARRDQSGYAVEQCRLAGAVRADKAGDPSRLDGEGCSPQSLDAIEAAADIVNFEKRHSICFRSKRFQPDRRESKIFSGP